MRVHLIGVAGTGMGQLASLLRQAGHDVSGSDVSFDPPMGPALERAGVTCMPGWREDNVPEGADLVVVGNAIRKDNVEAVRAEALGLRRASMSATLREQFLAGRRALAVCGTHGKTTTSSMCAWLLHRGGVEPGWFIGGVPKGLATGAAIGRTKRKLAIAGEPKTADDRAPFVVEGDEYDAVYWHKKPKFFDYVGVSEADVAIVTSIEHDHIDIYPTPEVYDAQFAELFERVPAGGLVVCDARDAKVRELAARHAKARVAFYALDGDDTGDVTPTWSAALAPVERGMQPFDLFGGGVFCGRVSLPVPGAHNVRNAVAALAACSEGLGLDLTDAMKALGGFEGVARRQELLGEPSGVPVYLDFAHHPTAVGETLRALRRKHAGARLWAVFEPRSATACRALHQAEYPAAFEAADRVVLAPLGRTNIPAAERLDLPRLARELGERATVAPSTDAIVTSLSADAREGDVIVLMSNGAFDGVPARLVSSLSARGGGA